MSEIDLGGLLQRPQSVTWLFAGDSITQGAAHTRGWRDYTELFKERLGELGRNLDVVVKTAVNGSALYSLEAAGLEDRVLRFKPDIVFLMFGTNDAAGGAVGLDSFRTLYRDIISRMRAAGITQIIMQATVPMMPVDPERVISLAGITDPSQRQVQIERWRERLNHIPDYAQATCDVARELGIDIIDHHGTWQATGNRGELMDGGFHPNEYGHRLIAHTIFRACNMWDKSSWTCRLLVPVNA